MPRHSEATLAAIKQAIPIVTLVSEYLPVHRAGNKFKALCPFHDDHNPSMELNPDRQSYKCWVCEAGGDIFDFVKAYERVDFPEALRMLADRAGIVLERPQADAHASPGGPSKADLMAVNAWAESAFIEAYHGFDEPRNYVADRGLNEESVERFRIGYAPEERDWLTTRARRKGFGIDILEKAGLVVRTPDRPVPRERFRGRLIFPIHDGRGRTLGFGGRILPESEKKFADAGKGVAKYLNSSETVIFQKRKLLYGSDLARPAARETGWVAVVEGYTDVIAAHQVGLTNVVGTLGTALGDDHIIQLRRLTDRVVLVFDGDEAGQKAADRSLQMFLSNEVDVRVLTLPDDLDPCDFLLREGAGPFRELLESAVDPLAFAIERASSRFDLNSIEGSRLASEAVLSLLGHIPRRPGSTIDLKVAKALDSLSRRLSIPVSDLKRRLGQIQQQQQSRPVIAPIPHASEPTPSAPWMGGDGASAAVVPTPVRSPDAAEVSPLPYNRPAIRVSELDPIDRELVQILLNEPAVVGRLITRVTVASLRDAPLRAILQACYDLYGEGIEPSSDRVFLRLDDAERSLAAGLLLPIDKAKLTETTRPATLEARLSGVLTRLAERERQERLRDIRSALSEIDRNAEPDTYRALLLEEHRLLHQRPDTKKANAS